jgi:lipopolysaccharide transport system ATP-binding protein
MSKPLAIQLKNVGKMYKQYNSPLDTALDMLGLGRLVKRSKHYREFWALRNIDLEIEVGGRIGIVGRNGAGKTTLLKLLTRNFAPTEGEIQVTGNVQALMSTGGGFHPEFTGYENIRASLVYQGLTAKEIHEAVQDIEEFTELGDFLKQPFKTYSAGMQARLTFATATAIKPEILIIDEVLGAGDGYFIAKATERMQQLIENSGGTIILVSHALDQILRFCDQAIWIDRGRITESGSSLETVKAYQAYILSLQDMRLKANNRHTQIRQFNSVLSEGYTESLHVQIILSNILNTSCDISSLQLLKNGRLEDELRVGDVQDSVPSASAYIVLDSSQWSESLKMASNYYRRLEPTKNRTSATIGNAIFLSYGFEDTAYTLRVRYRTSGPAEVTVNVIKNGIVVCNQVLPPSLNGDWTQDELLLSEAHETVLDPGSPMGQTNAASLQSDEKISHWPGKRSVTIEKVILLDETGNERAVYQPGESLILKMTVLIQQSGEYFLLPAASLYRLDGIAISNFIGVPQRLNSTQGEHQSFTLCLPSVNLGDGEYVFSVQVFDKEVGKTPADAHDTIDRAYRFQVVNEDPLFKQGIFRHPGEWSLE